jgi:hypothetical protein
MSQFEPKKPIEVGLAVKRCTWRQGSFISHEVAESLDLVSGRNQNEVALVVTHDCDCVQGTQVEPFLEVMIGTSIDKLEANLSNAKSTRILHLECMKDGQPSILEIRASPKKVVPKSDLLPFDPDPSRILTTPSKKVLAMWLRARYQRTSFPDELNRRLKPIFSKLEDIGKSNPRAIHGFYLAHDPDEELNEDELYVISLFIVYDSELTDAKKIAEDAANKLLRRFEEKYKTRVTQEFGVLWEYIELEVCEAIADTEFSFADMLSFQQFRLDYVSLREAPQGPLPEIA